MTSKINSHLTDLNKFLSDLEELGNLSGVDFKLGLKTIKDTWSSYRQEVREILAKEHMYSVVNLTEKTIKILERLTSKKRIKRLEEVLDEYSDILSRYEDYELHPRVLIADTFSFKKRFTSIDIASIILERVSQFKEALKPFFFVSSNDHEIHISRFKTLVKVAVGEMGKGINKVQLSDIFADLSGTFYDYSPKLIVQYCFKEGREHLQQLIKK